MIRDIERKHPQSDEYLRSLLQTAHRILTRKRQDKQKVYSVHEPSGESTQALRVRLQGQRGGNQSWWLVCRRHGNPYDGHTLTDALSQVARIAGAPKQVFVDMGYRGHGYTGDIQVHVDTRRRGRTPRSLWRWMKRRAAIEPGIGHLKHEHRMDRNRLKGTEGDRITAILCAAGMNFRKLQRFAAAFLRSLLLQFSGDCHWLRYRCGCQRACA